MQGKHPAIAQSHRLEVLNSILRGFFFSTKQNKCWSFSNLIMIHREQLCDVCHFAIWLLIKVTETVQKNIEVRLKESAEFQTQLEKKLMEVEKEKQELQDDKRKAIESMEQQVLHEGPESFEWKNSKSLEELFDID